MPGYAEYFERNRYKPKYFIGDRVFGYWQKIPFIGTVGNDNLVSEAEGPRISVFLDLPMMTKDGPRSLLIVKHRDIRQKLINYDVEETDRLQRKARRG